MERANIHEKKGGNNVNKRKVEEGRDKKREKDEKRKNKTNKKVTDCVYLYW